MKRLNRRIWLMVLLCVLLTACASQSASTDAATATAAAIASPTTQPSNPPEERNAEGRDAEGRDAEERDKKSDDGYVHITPSELALMLEDKDFLLINTHVPYGYEIKHTDAHISLDDEGGWLRHYPADKEAKIVLYCRSGKRSTISAVGLVAAGYTNVYHLDGGMLAWHADGLPLQDN